MDDRLSILNIGGHPKDAIMYAGGTMAKHVALGDRVCTMSPTHGMSTHLRAVDAYAKSGEMPDWDELVDERKRELVEAAKEIGVTDVRFLGHDDDITLPDKQIINEIADVIGEVRPDIIITHWPYDSVGAHANATQMTLIAMGAAAGIRRGKPYQPHNVAQVFYHVWPGMTNIQESLFPRVPTTLIDISDVADKKERAMSRFESQYLDSPEGDRSAPKLADFAAIHMRVPESEVFLAHYPQVYDTLPISPFSLKVARMSNREEIELLRDS